MKQDTITIKDIAKALNLSNSTISRALRGSYNINESTRKIVQEYAAKYDYKPNLMAQSLRNKQSRTIGISICSISNNFLGEVISGIESIASKRDYKTIITQSFESYEREVKNIKLLTRHAIDGLLVSLSTETRDISHLQKLHQNGIPVVFFDRVSNLIETHSVIANNKDGAYQATKHLLDHGYNSIAQITSSKDLSITKERFEGFEQALKEHNIAINSNLVKYCHHGGMIFKEVESAVDELLTLTKPPDAILTASDRITLSTVAILKRRKIKIPEQIAIVGFSNFILPEIIAPPLTTVTQPAFEMGKKAMELLLQLIENKKSPFIFKKIVLPMELHISESS